MAYNCMGSALVKDLRSSLLPHGAGQIRVAGEAAAVAAAKRISRSDAKEMAAERGIFSYGGKKQYVSGTGQRLRDFVHDTVRQSRQDHRQTIHAFHRADGAGSGMPDITEAARRMREGYVPRGTNSSVTMTPTGTMAGFGAAPGAPSPAGSVALDPNRPMRAGLSTRLALWKARMYGGAPLPSGLGLDFGALLSSSGGGGAGGLLSMFVKSPEQKAAEKAAKAQEAAAKAQVKAAKIAAASASEGRASTQRMLLIGGGVVAVGTLAWLFLRKKKG